MAPHRCGNEEGQRCGPLRRVPTCSSPSLARHICIEVEDLNAIVDRLRDDGFDTVGEVQDYADVYRLVYVRGPEGLIVELAENIASEGAS
jgi:catechol 2,3-dioxygenase-like lactoylglutathione lyase family enzyme